MEEEGMEEGSHRQEPEEEEWSSLLQEDQEET